VKDMIDKLKKGEAVRIPEGTSLAQISKSFAEEFTLEELANIKLQRGGWFALEKPLPKPIMIGPMAFVPFQMQGSNVVFRVNVTGVEWSEGGEKRLILPFDKFEELRGQQATTPEPKSPGGCAPGYCRKQPLCEGNFCAAVC
jgi:hypothetical protein